MNAVPTLPLAVDRDVLALAVTRGLPASNRPEPGQYSMSGTVIVKLNHCTINQREPTSSLPAWKPDMEVALAYLGQALLNTGKSLEEVGLLVRESLMVAKAPKTAIVGVVKQEMGEVKEQWQQDQVRVEKHGACLFAGYAEIVDWIPND